MVMSELLWGCVVGTALGCVVIAAFYIWLMKKEGL
jgi:hypothetical protein